MRRPVKWLLGAVAAVMILVVAALIVVPYLVDTPRVQALIASNASQALGRPVKFSSMSISVLPLPAVALHGLEIAEDPQFGTDPFLKLETGKVRLKLLPLLAGRVELGEIKLRRPVIRVIQTADGRMNISSLGTGAKTPEPKPGERAPRSGGASGGAGAALAAISIDHGVVSYVAHGKGGAMSQYRIEDLDVTISGGAPQFAFKGDFKVKPGDLAVKLSDGQVAINGGKPLTDAQLRGAVTLDAKDIGDLAKNALGPTPAFGGALKGKLALSGTLGAPAAAGEIELAKPSVSQLQPSCPQPKRRTLTLGTLKLNAGYRDQVLSARPLTTSLGDGRVTGNLSFSLANMHVQLADLGIKALPLEKLLVDYLCQGYAITGPLDLTGATAFNARDVFNTVSGPGTLRIGRGKVVGTRALALMSGIVRVGGALSSLLSAEVPNLGESPLEFDSITGTYEIVNGVLTTRDLLYTSRAMKVAIAGSYGFATERMDLDMTIIHGRGELKAKVTGPAASPSIRVNPAAFLRDVDPKKLDKGLGDLLKKIR